LSGLVAGNFSAYWLGISIVGLMAIAYFLRIWVPGKDWIWDRWLMVAPMARRCLASDSSRFGFLGMGPVTIAVDSYGPVTDNAQSVYELSLIEQVPDITAEVKRDFNIDV
jgi:K(+)-stimulated pyrophosphate-energized sodium pump